ncbi:Cell differentiation family, Rcd1-like protein [Leishmania donovani]|uniref:Cell differentiation family, Rcd1-like protein n=1 Tax=Leishmania donovani TaxID=5661 RepID=A0A504XCL3_LEIDO|nr:Cell differentiation family, Rcd1-like protein [Leishmania donovani]
MSPSLATGSSDFRRQDIVVFPQYPDVVREMLMHIQNLYHQDTRERAILTLSKKREKFTLLGPTLWYSVGVMAIFLQEIVSMYPLLNTPSSAPVKPIINRVSSVLTLLQSNICLFLYPFLRATPAERSEVLRLTSLGVIGALVKADDPAIISYLLNTEIFPICLKIMEQAIEISKIISTFIIQKLLMSDQGLVYACQNPSRFTAVADVLHRMVAEKGQQNEHVCGPRLLKHIIRCYLRLSENERAREALPKILPEELRNNTFQEYLDEDINMRKWLLQLLVNVGDEAKAGARITAGVVSLSEFALNAAPLPVSSAVGAVLHPFYVKARWWLS